MGDPKKQKKTYKRPLVLWNRERMDVETELMKKYGLKNKRELWTMNSLVRKFASDAKRLIPLSSEQAELEKSHLLTKVKNYGLLPAEGKIEDILSIGLTDVLERRLQTMLVTKLHARTISQSRQMISHGHVIVNNKKITSPSYLITLAFEETIQMAKNSPFSDADHPELNIESVKEKVKVEAEDGE